MTDKQRTIAAWVSVAILVALCIGYYAWRQAHPGGTTLSNGVYVPPLTEEVKTQLAKSNGFQYLVSYGESGFEPTSITINAGETIRFTNNSKSPLWIAATNASGSLYPGGGTSCAQSAFDSCKSLKLAEFWEFTFDTPGTWSYQNNADSKQVGTVVVR